MVLPQWRKENPLVRSFVKGGTKNRGYGKKEGQGNLKKVMINRI